MHEGAWRTGAWLNHSLWWMGAERGRAGPEPGSLVGSTCDFCFTASIVFLVLEFQIPLGKTFHCGSQARTVRKCCSLGGWHMTWAQDNWINTLGLSFDSRAEGSKEQVLIKNSYFLEILSSSGSWLSWVSISVFFFFSPFPLNQWIISYPSNKSSPHHRHRPVDPEVLVSTICYQKSPGCYRFYKLSEGVWTLS